MIEVTQLVNGAWRTTHLSGGELHRSDGPALVLENSDRSCLLQETWYCKGEIHREDGPACKMYVEGTLAIEIWRYRGKAHRVDGPARIFYSCEGEEVAHDHFLKDIFVPDFSGVVDDKSFVEYYRKLDLKPADKCVIIDFAEEHGWIKDRLTNSLKAQLELTYGIH